jgi:hypothetical protein
MQSRAATKAALNNFFEIRMSQLLIAPVDSFDAPP